MTTAKLKYSKEIEEAIGKVIKTNDWVEVAALDKSDIFAYPCERRTGHIIWGVDHPDRRIILRAVRKPDGRDEVWLER